MGVDARAGGQPGSHRPLERCHRRGALLLLGRVPSEVLQAAFHKAGQVNLLDIGTTFLYAAHFAFPLVVAFIFWTLERRLFYRYLLALLLMSFAAFICYLLIPVAPPRFAYRTAKALAVQDIAKSTFSQLHFSQVTTWLYGAMPGNQVAAFPSLHRLTRCSPTCSPAPDGPARP